MGEINEARELPETAAAAACSSATAAATADGAPARTVPGHQRHPRPAAGQPGARTLGAGRPPLPGLRQLHAGLPDLLLQQRRRCQRPDGRARRGARRRWASCFTADHSYMNIGHGAQVDRGPLPPVADAQAGHLDRPVRHVRLHGLRAVHHLVPGGDRSHRGSRRDSRRPSMIATAAPAPPRRPRSQSLDHARRPGSRPSSQEVPGIATYELAFEDRRRGASRSASSPASSTCCTCPASAKSAISISSDPGQPGTLGHTVRVAGNVTQALARKKVGDQIGGPRAVRHAPGRWTPAAATTWSSPAAASAWRRCGRRSTTSSTTGRTMAGCSCCTVRGRRNDLLYQRVRRLAEGGIEVEVTVDLGDADWRGHIGVVPVLFYRLRLNAARTCVMTCGPEIMMRFVIFEALARKLRPEHIYHLHGTQHEVRGGLLRPLPAGTGVRVQGRARVHLRADGAVHAPGGPADGGQTQAGRVQVRLLRRLPAVAAGRRGRIAGGGRRGGDRLLPGGPHAGRSAGPTTSAWSKARSPRPTTPSGSRTSAGSASSW